MKAQQDIVVRSKEVNFIAKTLIQDSAQKLEVDSKMHMGKPGNNVRVGNAISFRKHAPEYAARLQSLLKRINEACKGWCATYSSLKGLDWPKRMTLTTIRS
jgi:hypothetical protein